jgi:hypothetical protein
LINTLICSGYRINRTNREASRSICPSSTPTY